MPGNLILVLGDQLDRRSSAFDGFDRDRDCVGGSRSRSALMRGGTMMTGSRRGQSTDLKKIRPWFSCSARVESFF